ncbi:Sjogren's syndrome/scleroderma autoantigen 1 family protein [Thermococcus sp.]
MSISDEEIRKIIMPLMLSGAKMLDRHCPKCGSPLFEKDGKVFCPVCEHRKKQKANEMKGVEERLMEKLTELANSLPDDIEGLEKHLRVMELIINLLERYKALEGGE